MIECYYTEGGLWTLDGYIPQKGANLAGGDINCSRFAKIKLGPANTRNG